MYVGPEKAAKYYNVTKTTLRRWDNSGKIKTIRTKGNHRRYYIQNNNIDGQKIIYARVSSKKTRIEFAKSNRIFPKNLPLI